jgi:hypothetical protein
MTDDFIPWDDTVPADTGKWYPIFRANPKASARFFCISRHVVGCWVHVINRRDEACFANGGACERCDLHISRRWKGYLAVWEPTYCRVMLAELTADAVRYCQTDLTVDGPDLRCREISLYRLGTAVNSPVRCHISQATIDDALIPESVDVRAALRRIWGISG